MQCIHCNFLLVKKKRFFLKLVSSRFCFSQFVSKEFFGFKIRINFIYFSGCHPILLDKNDEFLSTLLKPLADANDSLDDDEIEKLPLQLQYYEGHRCQDSLLINKIIESLYQVSVFLIKQSQ